MPSLLPTSDRARVIILGNDAQLAARPAVPVQLARACLAYGYAFVAPASWGDELLAERATRILASGNPSAALLRHCPIVEATLGSMGLADLPSCASVSPPVATARYLRAAFAPNPLHITYVGRCAGGLSPEIDDQLSPDTLLARLTEAGCMPMKEPPHFDDVLPPDRRRFASNPGGAPAPAWLAATLPQATIRDVTRETVATVAKYREPNERCLVDLALASGCHCAADAHAMQRLEPPRAAASVVNLELVVDLTPPLLTDRHTPRTFASLEAGDPVDVDQLELAGSDSSGPIDYWVRPQAGPEPVPEHVSVVDVTRSGSGGAAGVSAKPAYADGPKPRSSEAERADAMPSPVNPDAGSIGGGRSGRAAPESASSAPTPVASTSLPVGEPTILRPPAPPKDGPRFSSAVAMGSSVVSLLLAPGLQAPAARHTLPVPPVTSRARTPVSSSDEHKGDQQNPVSAAGPAKRSAPVVVGGEVTPHVTTPPPQAALPFGKLVRRPVEFGSAAAVLSNTSRLSRRLPCRTPGALITRRPPDSTDLSEAGPTAGESNTATSR